MILRLGRVVRAACAAVAIGLLLAAGGCKSSRTVTRGSDAQRTERHAHGGGEASRREPSAAEEARLRVVRGSDNALVREAARWLGTPYRYGGSERGSGTDCSGLTMEVYRVAAGLRIPRNSAAQQEFCAPLKREALRAGDLVFFSSQKGRAGRVSHVGLYVDEGVFVHASSSRGVIASHLDEPYYASHYHSAGRVEGASPGRRIEAAPGAEIGDSVAVEAEPPVLAPVAPVVPAVVSAPAALPAPVVVPAAVGESPEREEEIADSIRSQVKMAF